MEPNSNTLSFRSICRIVAASLILATAIGHAAEPPAQKITRQALVIGNNQYPVGPLVNPVNDATAIAERLRQAGFSVTLKLDTGRRQLQDAIREFGNALSQNKGIGVFYYAGHGVQLNWRNFLVPVDAQIRNRADIQGQAVDLGLLIDSLGRARNALNLVILDACRNNPFGPDFRIDDRGLSQLDAPPGTLLAYATAPGNTAEDGEGSHGLYTDNLLREMLIPGAAVEDVFKRVRLAVRRTSLGSQIPWESTSLEAEFSFLPAKAASRDAAREFEADLATWQQLRAAESVEQLEAFVRQRPSGKFAELAQFRLDLLLRARGEHPIVPRAAALPSCPPGEVAPAAAYAGPPVGYRVGERYGYRRIDLLAQKETDRYNDTVSEISGDEVRFGGGQKVSDLFGNNVRAPDGRRWTPYQFFIHEYAVGKRWPAQFIVTDSGGVARSVSFELRVVGRERITLPAGTFDAYRIEARGNDLSDGTRMERTAWVAPERMRGFLAMETINRREGKLVGGERIELTDYTAPPAAKNEPATAPKPATKAPAAAPASGGGLFSY